jgi:hypothetical protein
MNRKLGLTLGIGHLTRVVKRLIESALTPAPLFLATCIILQMLPGRKYGWGGIMVESCGCCRG